MDGNTFLFFIYSVSTAYEDSKSFRVPDFLSASFFLLGVFSLISFCEPFAVLIRICGTVIFSSVFYGLNVLLIRGLGMGDIKYCTIAALFLGIRETFLLLLFGSVFILINNIPAILRKWSGDDVSYSTSADPIPFVPYLTLGFLGVRILLFAVKLWNDTGVP